MKCLLVLFVIVPMSVMAKSSQCFGTTSNGSVSDSVQLPQKGANFIIYHYLGHFLGRNYVHSKVAEVLLGAYEDLNQTHPKIMFKYAETGWKNGGTFKPHKTHQNGLSVDFMVPVKNKKGQSILFPTTISNKFGYSVEFDSRGNFNGFSIDYEALGLHLVALDKQAKKHGIGIKRVIFTPELRKHLMHTSSNKYLKENMTFMKNKAWVRHDEHYHVDFEINCKK